MKTFKKWIKYDWNHYRSRFIYETLGMICFVFSLTYLSIYGDDAKASFMLLANFFGGICYINVSIMRESINFLILNFVCIIIAIFGMMNL